MVRVLYIAGFGRNGSTILGNVLGNLPNFTHVGELRYIWDRGVLQNWDCGCGKPFSMCPFWQEVAQGIGLSRHMAHKMLYLREHGIHSRHLLFPSWRKYQLISQMDEYMRWLKELYYAVSRVAECEWIVDSSKFPSHAYLLNHIRGLDLRILHLVRDPRDVASSWWRRPKRLNPSSNQAMPRFIPIKSTILWLEWNYLINRTWGRLHNYMLLRYEDFVHQPRDTLRAILYWLNINPEVLDTVFSEEKTVQVSEQHTVSGNPVRFEAGSVEISQKQYQNELGTIWRFIVSGITIPLLEKFGYPIWK